MGFFCFLEPTRYLHIVFFINLTMAIGNFFTKVVLDIMLLLWCWLHFLMINRNKEQDLSNILGAIYVSAFFLSASSCLGVQPVVAIERTVLYRERAAGMYSSVSYAFSQVNTKSYHPPPPYRNPTHSNHHTCTNQAKTNPNPITPSKKRKKKDY